MSLAWKIVKTAVTQKVSPSVSHLILHVTNICNFRCQHCFVDFEKKPIDLTLDEIDEIAKAFPKLIWLNLGGGEPFIRSDLAEIVSKFRAEEISIPTNGWFTDKIVGTLQAIQSKGALEKLLLCISIDGLEKTHDSIRKQNGSFERLHETYRAIRKHFPKLRVKINTVVHERNIEEIVPLMEYVKSDLEPCFHSIMFLRGSPIDATLQLPHLGRLKKLEDQIFQIQQSYWYGRRGLLGRVHRNYQTIKREIATRIVEERSQVVPCLAGEANIVIYSNGQVAPCELLPPVGSLRHQTLSEIMSGEKWQKAVQRIQQKKCFCTHDCNMMENILFNFRQYPKLLLGT